MATEEVKTAETPPVVKDESPQSVLVVQKVAEVSPSPAHEKVESMLSITPEESARTLALANVDKEKKISFIKAWEQSEKSKIENKAQKTLSDVDSWEIRKKAEIETALIKFEEELERKRAEYGEKMRNKEASVRKHAEEKRATAVAVREEEILKTEELAANYCATGVLPKKLPVFKRVVSNLMQK